LTAISNCFATKILSRWENKVCLHGYNEHSRYNARRIQRAFQH